MFSIIVTYSPKDITETTQGRNNRGQVVCWQESLSLFFDPIWKSFVGGGDQWKPQV